MIATTNRRYAPPVRHDDSDMRGPRSRNQDGQLRQKRATHLGTLEDMYAESSDRRSDCHLGTLRELRQMSLSAMLKADPEVTHGAPLNGRHRNQDGRVRAKRADTRVASLRQTYGSDFAAGLPGDMTLGALRSLTGKTLTQMLQD